MDLVPIHPVAEELAARFAAAGHRLYLVGGSVRDALLGRTPSGHSEQTDLDFTTDARPAAVLAVVDGWASAVWDTGIAFGTVGARRHGVDHGDHDVPVRRLRPREPQPGRRLRRDDRGRPGAPRLHRQRDGGRAHRARRRAFVDPYGGLAALAAGRSTPRPRPRSRSPTTRCGCCARPGSSRSSGLTPAPRVVAAMTAMAGRAGADHEGAGAGASSPSCSSAGTRAAGSSCSSTPACATYVLPEVPAMRLAIDEHMQHKDVYTHSLVVLEQAIDRETDGPGPRAAAGRAAARHRQARRPGAGAGRAGELPPPRGRRGEADAQAAARAALPEGVVDEVAQLVFLHLRFHGYGSGEWTDSAVRRYVTDAGPLLDRLHELVRSDCTTRNRRRAAALQRSYDDLERRIAALRAQEELDAIRPDLDGNAIMQLLGIPPGPLVGRRTSTCSRCGWSAGRWAARRRRRSCGGGRRRTASGSADRANAALGKSDLPNAAFAHFGPRPAQHAVVGEQAEQVHPRRRRHEPRGDARRRGAAARRPPSPAT